MKSVHQNSSESSAPNISGLEAELDLAEMEIASARFGEARLRFTRMSRHQRETPRALMLRARATETEESRRQLAFFVREAVKKYGDALSRSQLSAALAMCGDRAAALQVLPQEGGLNAVEKGARQQALEALGSVPDLPEHAENSLGAILSRKLSVAKRSR